MQSIQRHQLQLLINSQAPAAAAAPSQLQLSYTYENFKVCTRYVTHAPVSAYRRSPQAPGYLRIHTSPKR
jgi:hypothetical protein